MDLKAGLLQHRAKPLPHKVAAMTNPIGRTRPAIVVAARAIRHGLAPLLNQARTRRRIESNLRRTRAIEYQKQVEFQRY